MKTFFKSMMSAILVSLSATAFAQCLPMNAPGPPRHWDGARGCYVPQGTPAFGSAQTVMIQSQYGQPIMQSTPQPFYGSSYPVGVPMGNTGQCGGLAERLGRVIGANRGNDARNTENGGFLGYIAGGFFCPMMSNQGQQRVMVQQGVVTQQAPQQFANPTYGGVQQQAVVQGQRPAAQLQETSFAAAGDQDTCRLRSNGNVIAEIKLPLSVKREEAKQICNEWQQREASARGLR